MIRNSAIAAAALPSARFGWRSLVSFGPQARGTLLRVCASLSLFLILLYWFDVSEILRQLVSIESGYLAIALALFAAQFAVACARWLYLLKRQERAIRWSDALSIYGVGALANIFLVTSIAGISARAALLVRSGFGLSCALASLTAERIAAMIGLALCSVLGILTVLPYLKTQTKDAAIHGMFDVVLLVVIMLSAFSVLFALRLKKVREFVGQVWAAFSSIKATLLLAGSSVTIVLLGFAAMSMLARGMALEIDPIFFASVMPAIAFLSALPISVGGWGVREGMMVIGLSIFSISPESALALSTSYGLAGMVVVIAIGGLLALLQLRRRRTESGESASIKRDTQIIQPASRSGN